MKNLSLYALLLAVSSVFGEPPKVPKTLKVTYDKIDQITIYKSKSTSPNLFKDMWTPIQLIINHKEGEKPTLKLRLKWRDLHPIFATKVKLVFGNNPIELNLPTRLVEADSAAVNRLLLSPSTTVKTNINEIYPLNLNEEQINQIRQYLYNLGKKESFLIRFYGSTGTTDLPKGLSMGGLTQLTLNKNAKEMREVLKFYDILLTNQ